ncbi:MAG: biopolymer transporter Tol, partial [Candidatus Neomarinimicrobiota bacterium]
MQKKLVILIIALGIPLCSTIFAQSFGQNKVQYRQFDWSYLSTPHFDIYFYGEEVDLARFTLEAANEAYEQISKHLRWTLKKRVPIIVYHSHNDFQTTNVVGVYMREGIGGVTELFKNRVVIPFEGDYTQFRHVIHHELVHAVINDMIYGGRMQNVISNRNALRLPLWVNEGLAEYLSSNWDTKADMTIRDIAINERIPSIQELEYFMAYKGGQSVWRFIAEKYGREKIGEIFHAMKNTGNAEKGFKRALGLDFDDLTKQWHKYIKKEYWPDVAGRDEVGDIAKSLTDHKEQKNYYNISPTISPDGSKIAVLSDRSGYMDIYIIDAINGKQKKQLVKGNRSVDFEELKFLQPGI